MTEVVSEVVQPESTSSQPTDGPAPALPERSTRSRLRRWGRRFLLLAVLAVALYLFRAPLLRGVAGWLVVTEPVSQPTVALAWTFDAFDQIAELRRTCPDCQVLVIEYPPSRVIQMGILPTHLARAQALARHVGIPESAVCGLETPSARIWDVARRLDVWLAEHPDTNLVVYCARFDGRRLRYIFDAVLKPDAAGRVHVQAVSNSRYDETNWWKLKEGKLTVFASYVGMVHTWVEGDGSSEEVPWNPDQYEQKLSPAP